MISAFSFGARVLGEPAYAHAAARAADFILAQMQKNGRLLRRYREKESAILGFQDDYSLFALGLLDLYEATFDFRWLREALRLTRQMLELFWDKENGGFFYTAHDAESLITRTKEFYDGAVPSGNSTALLLLIRLEHAGGSGEFSEKIESLLQSNAVSTAEYPMAYPFFLSALDFHLGPAREIVLAGNSKSEHFSEILRVIHQSFHPNQVLLHKPAIGTDEIDDFAGYVKDQKAVNGKPTVYVCENFSCRNPMTDFNEIKRFFAE